MFELIQNPVLMGNFTVLKDLEEALNAGDPEVRKWFLVRNSYAPFVLCTMYALFVKVVGPILMKNRQPMEVRNLMVVYNFFLVMTYLICTANALYRLFSIETEALCIGNTVTADSHIYQAVTSAWIIYLCKYVECFDTIFFVLRKKDHLITNLHVIHHFVLPIIWWVLFRTERSGFQAVPAILNSMVHIVMYTYYGLSAIGPKVRKYLWWKRYLTIAQMIQFILILTWVLVIMPLTGCTISKVGLLLDVFAASFFLALFYNFYQRTFNGKAGKVKGN